MKNLLLFLGTVLFLSSCAKQEPIAQAELTGIWKLNGYSSSNYKVEITNDGHAYWFNYNDVFNKVQEFEVEYDMNKNTMRFYCPNSNHASHTLRIYRNRNKNLSFTNPVYGTDANGESITNYDTYYKMN